MKITIYTRNECHACNIMKHAFDNYKVKYKVYNVDESKRAMQRVKDLGYSSVPLLLVDDVVKCVGYSPDDVTQAINDYFETLED